MAFQNVLLALVATRDASLIARRLIDVGLYVKNMSVKCFLDINIVFCRNFKERNFELFPKLLTLFKRDDPAVCKIGFVSDEYLFGVVTDMCPDGGNPVSYICNE